MRLIHTSDVHLDAVFAVPGAPPGFANRRRQALRDVLHDVLTAAAEWPADAVLIAGDLYDHERVTPDTVAFLKRAFEALGDVPVFIAPGNHDPHTVTSPYALEAWPGNVHVFREPEWEAVRLEDRGLAVHGFGFDGPEISRNPFGALQLPNDDAVHVAVAHGSEMGAVPSGKGAYAPFSAANAAARGLRYLALGHFHDHKSVEAPFGTRMCYSGAPEGHDFGETGLRHYLRVEVLDEHVEVTPVPSSRTVYTQHRVDCTGFGSAQDIVEAVRALKRDDGRDHVARVRLTGAPPDAWGGELAVVKDSVAPSFAHLDLVDALEPAEDHEALAREQTSLGAFTRRMLEEAQLATDDHRRAVAQRALEVGVAAYRDRPLPIRGLGDA
jgi:DNA repair exonuclease SbcCD nuclease subunit